MGRRAATGLLIAFVIGFGCSGEQAYSPRPPDGGGGGVGPGSGGIAGDGGMGGLGGSGGSAGSIDTGGMGGDAGAGGSAGAAGGGGNTVVAGSAGASGSAGTAGTAGATGSAGRGGAGGSGGIAGSSGGRGGTGGSGGAAGSAGTGGTGGSAGTGGNAGTGGTAGSAGTGGSAGGGGIRDGGSGPYTCPAVIYGSLDTTDPVQYGRENRTFTPGACGANKNFPGDDADPMDAGGVIGNPHYYDVYHFTNPGSTAVCFTFTLDYDGMNTFIQRYITVYTTYDPTNIRTNYLSDVGNVLNPPQQMAITVAGGSSIDIVIFSVNVAGSSGGVGIYTLSCNAGTGDGGT
ncbi:MAG TPA: hypothetical protein VIF57_28850 [Polyangia bacterium]|jgi:hypothetical protein